MLACNVLEFIMPHVGSCIFCESTILYESKILTLHVGNLMFWTKHFWEAYWRLESHNPAFILYHTPILLKAPPTPYLINRRRVLDLNLDSNSVKESNFAWVAREDTPREGFCSESPTNIKHNDVIKTNIFISVDTGLSTRQAGVNGNARSDLNSQVRSIAQDIYSSSEHVLAVELFLSIYNFISL